MAEQSRPITLEPCSKQKNPTKTPLLSDIFMEKNLKKWPIKVNFPGCRKPHQNWANWVEKLSIKHAKAWVLAGICDGILCSLHEINLTPEIVLGLSEYWCSETNTFVFPWGEATITLEDVNVLFGLPVLGESVAVSPFEGEAKSLERILYQVKNTISSCSRELDAWVKFFSEEDEEVEHVGFLAFWLSAFVFPDVHERTVGSHVFSVAVSLARGKKVALAPAVLACLYQNLTFVTQRAADFGSAKKEISVPAPCQIVQLWALERFPWLGSKLAKPLGVGYPRIARWDKESCKAKLVDVRRSLRSSGDCFCWRPYALDLGDFDKEKALLSSALSGEDDEELKSFRVCLQLQELIGIDCTATYQPQRVMMQFGLDQKVPSENKLEKESKSDGENAISEGIEKVLPSDEEADKKVILSSEILKTELNDEDNADLDTEALKLSWNDNGSKQNSGERDDERPSTEDLVILDSDEELEEKMSCKDVMQSRTNSKSSKRRLGESADYPVFIYEHPHKVVKKSGVSFATAIDVENY